MKEQDMPAVVAPPPLVVPPPGPVTPTRPEPPDTLTKTERLFFKVLSDGKPHGPDELTRCLWEEMAANLRVSIGMHVSRIRAKVAPLGYYVQGVQHGGRLCYVLTRPVGC